MRVITWKGKKKVKENIAGLMEVGSKEIGKIIK
jgi:hypothetical protein